MDFDIIVYSEFDKMVKCKKLKKKKKVIIGFLRIFDKSNRDYWMRYV